MDLNRVRAVKDAYDALEGEAKEEVTVSRDLAYAALRKQLPAITDLDRAAVAWFIARLLDTLRGLPVGDISTVLKHSASGYGVAAVEFLGWGDSE
jgi:hypothetical protein